MCQNCTFTSPNTILKNNVCSVVDPHYTLELNVLIIWVCNLEMLLVSINNQRSNFQKSAKVAHSHRNNEIFALVSTSLQYI